MKNKTVEKIYSYRTEFAVRDYECDLQGVVNNAVYQNYLEHARHEILRSSGIHFARLHDEGIDPVLIHADIHYKYSLRSNDRFFVGTNMVLDGRARIIFEQDIVSMEDNRVVLNAAMTAMVLKNGKPVRLPEEFVQLVVHPHRS